MFLEIADEEILATEFKVVAEVIDALVGLQTFLIYFVDELLFAPDDVPVILVGLLVMLLLKPLQNAVGEVGAVLDARAEWQWAYIWEWNSLLMLLRKNYVM